jgi:hypothetical protein
LEAALSTWREDEKCVEDPPGGGLPKSKQEVDSNGDTNEGLRRRKQHQTGVDPGDLELASLRV